MNRATDRDFPDIETRFIAKVSVSETGCWLWNGYVDKKGYGVFGVGNRKLSKAHRYSYERFIGKVPDGLFLDHLCRVRNCVNPHHLEPVTNQENVIRGFFARGPRKNCKKGHPFTEENTYINPRRVMCCKTCQKVATKSYNEKRKSQCVA